MSCCSDPYVKNIKDNEKTWKIVLIICAILGAVYWGVIGLVVIGLL